MICRRLPASLLLTFLVLALVSAAPFASAGPAELTVAIAVPARGPHQKGKPGPRVIDIRQAQSHFHVVVTNTSGKPQRLWQTWNSWGYYNLRFEVADAAGKVLYAIKKKPRAWTRNFPSWIELASGEPFVMDVSFDRESWTLPFLKDKRQGEFPLRMRAVFGNRADKQTEEHKVWTGEASSPFQDYRVRYWR